jgi:hypothetical protein
MPTPFWAALASLLGVVLWLITRRQPRTLLRSTDTAAVAALNRAQIELVSQLEPVAPTPDANAAGPQPQAGEAAAMPLPLPTTTLERRAYLLQLRHWAAGDPEQRLQAMQAARRWRHPDVLPLLRRGLRDGDPRVMAAAAAAIAPYRTRPTPASPGNARRPATSESARQPAMSASARQPPASSGAFQPGGARKPGGGDQPGGAVPRRVSRTR